MPESQSPNLSISLDSEASVDRISTLSDALLSHILSFLPTKHAVRTSILSNRWKFLWTWITNLDFDVYDYTDFKDFTTDTSDFIHFVNRVLLLLNQRSIHKFRLNFDNHCEYRNVITWMDVAIARGTQELDLCMVCFDPEKFFPLPRRFFTSSTLVVLKLEGQMCLSISTASVSFPSLKILHLRSVDYEDDECVRKLLANCPILEDLVVQREWDNVISFTICSSSLKKLNIDIQGGKLNWGDSGDDKVEINAPALQYLYLKTPMDLALENLSSLVEANVDIHLRLLRDVDDYYDTIVNRILKGLSNVKFLSLSGYTMKSLAAGSHLLTPKFPNLKRLKVNFTEKSHELKLVPKLIQYSDKLEELICT